MSNTSNSMNTTNTTNTTNPDDSVLSFNNTTNMDMPEHDPNVYHGDGYSFGNIPPIPHQEDQQDTFPGSATALSEAVTPFADNNPSYYDDYGPPNDGGPMDIGELNTSGTSNLNRTDEESLLTNNSSFGISGFSGTNSSGNSDFTGNNSSVNSVNSGNSGNSFGSSRITFGGKKVKKTALDELIKDMNRITYILKGIKVERKVIKKKSKKNKNKKNNKRTYKKIKRIPRNNRKRSVKKSKK